MRLGNMGHNLSENLELVLEPRDKQNPPKAVRKGESVEVGDISALHLMERFPRSHHAFPSLREVLSIVTQPDRSSLEFYTGSADLKLILRQRREKLLLLHAKLVEDRRVNFEIKNCVLSVSLTQNPPQSILGEMKHISSASLSHRFSTGDLEELFSVVRDKECEAGAPCMRVRISKL